MKQENYIRGMIMIILSAFFFACMNVSVRLAGDLSSVQKSFFRNLLAAFLAAIILLFIRLSKSALHGGQFGDD